MPVKVTPETFSLVLFDAGVIERTLTTLLDRLGLTARDLRVDVDESTPIVRTTVEGDDPIVMSAGSGAFEDPRRPRHLSEVSVVTNAGRPLLRVRDRADGSFADAPADDDLTLAQTAAWDAYCVGRLGRLGYPVHEQRWRYNFRNRHGFTDVADGAFDRLWAADRITWAELAALSDGATVVPS
jgi:hypothetical protein